MCLPLTSTLQSIDCMQCAVDSIVQCIEVYSTQHCKVYRSVQYTVVYSTQQYTVHSSIQYTVVYSTQQCTIHRRVQYTIIYNTVHVFTFDCDFVLSGARVGVEQCTIHISVQYTVVVHCTYVYSTQQCTLQMFLPLTVTLCSPVPGWVQRSTWTDTSPTAPSAPVESKQICI